jgi:hypothetical protein
MQQAGVANTVLSVHLVRVPLLRLSSQSRLLANWLQSNALKTIYSTMMTS